MYIRFGVSIQQPYGLMDLWRRMLMDSARTLWSQFNNANQPEELY
jgi:hypothetical protein